MKRIVSIACCRGQPNPKNDMKEQYVAVKEGPRTHVVTEVRKLYIAATYHKALKSDHFYKSMTPIRDHLNFYQVGREARDEDHGSSCLTGSLETLITSTSERNRY